MQGSSEGGRQAATPLRLIALAALLAFIGWLAGDLSFTRGQMTYGDADVAGKPSFVQRLWTGTADLAALRNYRDIAHVEAVPLVALTTVFIVFLFLVRWRNPDVGRGINRWLTYWLTFVAARLGVIRVSGMGSFQRCQFGVFPFLNCQACEMATGACPIGLLQSSLLVMRLPYLALASVVAFGAAFGRVLCGWACPFGMLSDIVDRVSRHRVRLTVRHGWTRFAVLAGVVALPPALWLAGSTELHPFCASLCPSGVVYGLLPYHATTGHGAVTAWGVVLFHVAVAAVFIAAMVLVSGWFFCHTLCPLGAALGLFNRVAMLRVQHDNSKCDSCNKCVEVCPFKLQLGDGSLMTASSCIGCSRCVTVCKPSARSWYVHPMLEGPAQALGGVFTRPAARSEGPRYGLSLRGRVARTLLPWLAKTPGEMARYARSYSIFYKRLYAGHGDADFRALPILRKERVRDVSPYHMVAEPHAHETMYYGETTGSLGSPTSVFYTRREFESARMMAHLSPYGPHLLDTLAANRTAMNGLAFGFTVAGMTFGDVLTSAGALVANVGSRSTLATPERIARAFVRLRPSVMMATPIDFVSWMRIAREDHPATYDEAISSLKILMTTAELCSPERSRRLAEHFGLVHINTYACVEGFFALPCPCGENHVLASADAEVLDERLETSREFGSGRFAFTNLVKQSSPMVRYLLDDQVTISRSACPYGYEKSILPHGRWELSVVLGAERVNVAEFEDAVFRHGLFGDFRAEIFDDRIELRVEEYAEPPGALERLERGMAERFGLPVRASLLPFGAITAYRQPRAAKPIYKVLDRRTVSTQKVPEVM